MAEPFKVCPICETSNHRNATMCVTCGTSLTDVPVSSTRGSIGDEKLSYDYRYGETDLLEESLGGKARAFLIAIVGTLVFVMIIGAALIAAPLLSTLNPPTPTPGAGGGAGRDAFLTNTPGPTIALATVTIGPPTLTPTETPSVTPTITMTPTREPCRQVVGAGEGLYALIARCGHRDLAVVDLVVELNNLNDATSILAGQELIIPWPTETPDPNAALTQEASPEGESSGASADTMAAAASDGGRAVAVSGQLSDEDIRATQAVDPFFRPTPTNPPGIMNHVIAPNENITEIIVNYNTSMDVLEQLNPEVVFSQCELGQRFGGGSCIVLLSQGQVLRVPAPTPTPTLSPTPSGSETATPTATATFNAPYATGPSNRAYFQKDEFVTLRWASTGFLLRGETYRVRVENKTTGEVFTGDTTDLFFVLPLEWQGEEETRYEYVWTVSVASQDQPNRLRYTTEPRTFTWEGR